jgi:DNA-binding MarR family transcriptional regulator
MSEFRRTGRASIDGYTRELATSLGRVNRALARAYPGPLTNGALSALATVVREGPIRVGELARREGIQPPALSRIVAWLEQGGYLQRQVDPDDRRSAHLVVTEVGRAVYDDVWARRSQALAQAIEKMSEPDKHALLAAVPRLHQLADRISP